MSPDARLCLALDGCTPRQALAWIARTRDRIGVFKVGLELFCAGGPALVDACRDAGAGGEGAEAELAGAAGV